MTRTNTATFFATMFLAATLLRAAVLTVGADGWSSIQEAIDAASEGDTVRVVAGEYVITEPITFRGKAITVESEAGAASTEIKMSLTPSDPNRAGVVVFEENEPQEAQLTGFTLSGGSGTRYTEEVCDLGGGGILVRGSARPVIRDCVIERNRASGNEFECALGGGVLCADSSSPRFLGCVINHNVASAGGGTFIRDASSPEFLGCSVTGNLPDGIECVSDSTPLVRDCIVAGNGNGARVSTAGIWSASDAPHVVFNTIVVGNKGSSFGGIGSASDPGTFLVMNCTITANLGDCMEELYCRGATYCQPHASLDAVNCIVWNNSPARNDGVFSHSLLNKNPRFVRSPVVDFERTVTVNIAGTEYTMPDYIVDLGDLRLRNGSPAIDGGTGERAPATDIEGNSRPCGDGVDIGAYEYGECRPPVTTAFKRGDVNQDGRRDLADAISILGYLFGGAAVPGCMDSADSNDDGGVDLSDAVELLGVLFGNRPRLPAPYFECGEDTTADSITCKTFTPCNP